MPLGLGAPTNAFGVSHDRPHHSCGDPPVYRRWIKLYYVKRVQFLMIMKRVFLNWIELWCFFFVFRSRDEQSSTSVIHRHVLDGLQEKLNDAEVALRQEREERHRENVSFDDFVWWYLHCYKRVCNSWFCVTNCSVGLNFVNFSLAMFLLIVKPILACCKIFKKIRWRWNTSRVMAL